MRKISVLIILVLGFNLVEAQNWVSLAGANNGTDGRVLFPDSITGKLFVAGSLKTLDNHSSWVISAWDGLNWDTTYSFGAYDGPITAVSRYQNELYVGGFIIHACNKYCNGFAKWDGNCWDSLNISHNSTIIVDLCIYNNLLYWVGIFDTISNLYSPMIIAWNGNNWIPNGLPHYSANTGGSGLCCVYHNSIYFAGNFSDSLGQLYGFVKFDGTNWSMPSPGFGGLIHSMAVYNDELYMSGNYFVNSPANYIVKWNDTTLSAVGNEFYGEAWHLRVIGDKLFAAGGIDTADGIPIHDNLAVWDGSHWSDFSNDTFNNGVMDVAVYNNELYVVGAFTKINGDSIGGVAKYNGWHLSDHDIKSTKGKLEIFPNPTSDVLNILLELPIPCNNQQINIKVFDVLGRTVIEKSLMCDAFLQTVINIGSLPNESYLLQVITPNKIYNKTFILYE